MRFQALGKALAIGATVLVLGIALARIGFLVDERRAYQQDAVHSVQQSLAGAQTLTGPVLQRQCSEEWEVVSGEGKERRLTTARRSFHLRLVPTRLAVASQSQTDLRYRGLFKVNGYSAHLDLDAQWADLSALQPQREHVASHVSCGAVSVWIATTDVRGVRGAQITVDGRALAVKPGTGNEAYAHGLRAELPGFAIDTPLPASLALKAVIDLIGTAEIGLVPVAETTEWKLQSDWPHPSFGGRFLPTRREVTDSGFNAVWSVSSLATTAPLDVVRNAAMAADKAKAAQVLDTLSVSFVDPVNPYMLSDRAIKYGLLFVVLTFTAVLLAETLARGRVRRVHPVQYALVGLALCLFFLLLLSLSEHLAFGIAYAIASAACVLLLGFYGRHMLGSLRDGLWFGTGMALLYGLLYLLLLREQTALVLGSIGLFGALAAVMLLTRRVDWYRLAPLNGTDRPPVPGPSTV